MTWDRLIVEVVGGGPSTRRQIRARSRARGVSAFVAGATESGPFPPSERWYRREPAGFQPIASSAPFIPRFDVLGRAELASAVRSGRSHPTVAVRWRGDRVIPLEELLSIPPRKFRVWVVTDRPAEVPAALGALERGADRVVIRVRTPTELEALFELVGAPGFDRLPWGRAKVVGVRPAGSSERVLVDLVDLLRPSEGLLVGSSARFLFHVASEAEGSEFSRPRPFRVNAGSPHSYVLMADGTTRYLAELEAGDAVLVADPPGRTRSVRVGRLKLERRPMALVRARRRSSEGTIFLQEAETVRLTSTKGRIALPTLAIGDPVRVVEIPAARHMGRAIEEHLLER